MDEDKNKKNVLKLITKEKPPEETPEVTPDDLLKEGVGSYESLIMIGWKEDRFRVSWSTDLTIDEVYLQLDLAKDRLLKSMYEF